MKFVRKAEGMETVPNYEFWKDLPALIMVSVFSHTYFQKALSPKCTWYIKTKKNCINHEKLSEALG